jgi:hypothetical protein
VYCRGLAEQAWVTNDEIEHFLHSVSSEASRNVVNGVGGQYPQSVASVLERAEDVWQTIEEADSVHLIRRGRKVLFDEPRNLGERDAVVAEKRQRRHLARSHRIGDRREALPSGNLIVRLGRQFPRIGQRAIEVPEKELIKNQDLRLSLRFASAAMEGYPIYAPSSTLRGDARLAAAKKSQPSTTPGTTIHPSPWHFSAAR